MAVSVEKIGYIYVDSLEELLEAAAKREILAEFQTKTAEDGEEQWMKASEKNLQHLVASRQISSEDADFAREHEIETIVFHDGE